MRKSYPHEIEINDYFSYLRSMIKIETEEFEEFCLKVNHLMEVVVDDLALETLPLSRSIISRPLSDSLEVVLKKIILQGLN